jgi:osmoprotectant transport system permease protein
MSEQGATRRAAVYFGLLAIFLLGVFSERSNIIVDITETYWDDITFLSAEHLMMVLISGGLAIVCGIPLGIWLSRPAMLRYAETFMQVFNIGTTVPTLAILALSMSLLGIGKTPAIFALWVATLLPIVRNTFAGLTAVPDFLLESARGMGMTPGQMLIRVELPNALYVMFAGIRTALAINVGTVPLAFLIGGGGLGELIFTGIDLDELGMMMSGAIPVALLAIMTDFIVGQVQHWMVPAGVAPDA